MGVVGIGSEGRHCRVGHCDEWDYKVGDGTVRHSEDATEGESSTLDD